MSGLSSDINADTSQSQWAISVYYLCVIALVLPSLIILRRWRAPFWIGIVIGYILQVYTSAMVTNDTVESGELFRFQLLHVQIMEVLLHHVFYPVYVRQVIQFVYMRQTQCFKR